MCHILLVEVTPASLYDFVTTQQGINSTFEVTGSLINLNVGSFRSYTKVVTTQSLDNTNDVIRLSYDDVHMENKTPLLLFRE